MSLPTYQAFNNYMEVTRDSGHVNMFHNVDNLRKRFTSLTKRQAEALTTKWVFGNITYNEFNDIIFERSES